MEAGLRHEALIYDGPEEFLAGTVPFLREGLEAGELALVAVGRAKAALLEGELGADAPAVLFADIEELGRNPARLIPFWRDLVDEHEGRPLRGVGEPVWPGRVACEIDECQRHEALLNLAFAREPGLALLCPYDGAALDDGVLERVAASHSRVARDGVAEPGSGPEAGGDCFAGALPARPGAAESLEFDLDALATVRRQVEAVAREAGLGSPHASDLVASASELAANSVAHGGGAGTLRTWTEDDRVLVEVEDRGEIREPLVGRVRPPITQEGGRGLWLANQLCDLVQIRSGAGGTTVRLQMATSEPGPTPSARRSRRRGRRRRRRSGW